MANRAVMFLHQHEGYNAGETAAFPPAVARSLVSEGVAELAGTPLAMTDEERANLPSLGADDGTLVLDVLDAGALLPPADGTEKTSPGTGEHMTEVKPGADDITTFEGSSPAYVAGPVDPGATPTVAETMGNDDAAPVPATTTSAIVPPVVTVKPSRNR